NVGTVTEGIEFARNRRVLRTPPEQPLPPFDHDQPPAAELGKGCRWPNGGAVAGGNARLRWTNGHRTSGNPCHLDLVSRAAHHAIAARIPSASRWIRSRI